MGELRPGMRLIAAGELTNGAFEVIEDMRDAGAGPPPHVHRDHQEWFYVLEGRFTFTRGDEQVTAGPGDFVHVPAATRHRYRAEVDRSKLLFIVAPAGLAEFMREQGRLIAAGATAHEAMLALEGRFDTHPVD